MASSILTRTTTGNTNLVPSNVENSNLSAQELLKPDPPLLLEEKEEGEDDLDALRMAALRSIKPKKSIYKVQAHPVRSNLLSIVPVEDQNVHQKHKTVVFNPKVRPLPFVVGGSNNSSPAKTKFNQF
jgi:hypothetical protein